MGTIEEHLMKVVRLECYMRQMRTLVKVNQEEKRLWERKITEGVKTEYILNDT